MKRLLSIVLWSSCLFLYANAENTHNHLIGADISTITGSGITYRLVKGNLGYKVSTYYYTESDAKESSFNLGFTFQYNINVKPLTRLYALTGGCYGNDKTEHYYHNLFRWGAGFGAELRAFQAVKNEDLIFFVEVGEIYFSHKSTSRSTHNSKTNTGFIPAFTTGVGIEF